MSRFLNLKGTEWFRHALYVSLYVGHFYWVKNDAWGFFGSNPLFLTASRVFCFIMPWKQTTTTTNPFLLNVNVLLNWSGSRQCAKRSQPEQNGFALRKKAISPFILTFGFLKFFQKNLNLFFCTRFLLFYPIFTSKKYCFLPSLQFACLFSHNKIFDETKRLNYWCPPPKREILFYFANQTIFLNCCVNNL